MDPDRLRDRVHDFRHGRVLVCDAAEPDVSFAHAVQTRARLAKHRFVVKQMLVFLDHAAQDAFLQDADAFDAHRDEFDAFARSGDGLGDEFHFVAVRRGQGDLVRPGEGSKIAGGLDGIIDECPHVGIFETDRVRDEVHHQMKVRRILLGEGDAE